MILNKKQSPKKSIFKESYLVYFLDKNQQTEVQKKENRPLALLNTLKNKISILEKSLKNETNPKTITPLVVFIDDKCAVV